MIMRPFKFILYSLVEAKNIFMLVLGIYLKEIGSA